MSPVELRKQWAHRIGFFGLRFADTRQIYPKPRDKNVEGKYHPSHTTEPTQETHKMPTTETTNGTNQQSNTVSPEELAELMRQVRDQVKESNSLKTMFIDGAITGTSVMLGVTGAALLIRLIVKPVVPAVPVP